MSHKQDKKIRQLYRRDFKLEELKFQERLAFLVKPKPRFVPWWLWMKIVKMVIKVK